MATQRILLPILGQDFSIPSTLLNEKSSFGQNIKQDNGVLRQREGHEVFGNQTPMNEEIIHTTRYQQENGTLKLVRLSSLKSQAYNDGTKDWDDITKSGTDWSGTAGINYFSSIIFNNELLITNGVDSIQKWTGAGLCTDLDGSPPIAKFMEEFGEYVVLANVVDTGVDYPFRIQWCNTADSTDWLTGNAGYIDLTEDDGVEITGIKRLNDLYVVFKENAIYTVILVDTVDVMNANLIVSNINLLNNRCVVTYNGLMYFMSDDCNVYIFNGTTASPIGDKVKTQIYNNLNKSRKSTCWARRNVLRKTIQFYITTDSNNYPTESWHFSYEDGSVFYDTCNNVSCATTFKNTDSQESWDSDPNPWDTDTTIWDFGLGGTGFKQIIAKTDGYIYEEKEELLNDANASVDVAIDEQYVTPDLTFSQYENFVRFLGSQLWVTGDSVSISYSIDFGTTWEDIAQLEDLPSSFTEMVPIWFDVKNPFIRFRFRNNKLDEKFDFKQLSLEGNIEELLYT
ncbi:MAG: hypothetical protein ABIJ17_01860 [Patescibacteria group bacterium]